MKLVTYRAGGTGAPLLGAWHDGVVYDLSEMASAHAATVGTKTQPLPSDMVTLLALGEGALGRTREALHWATRVNLAGVPDDRLTLMAPVPRPPKIIGVAGNYPEHIGEEGGPTRFDKSVHKAKFSPKVFFKPPTAVIGPGEAILLPSIADQVNWELELAVVIGRRGKHIPLEKVFEYVAGYCICNDVTACSLRLPGGCQPMWGHDYEGKWFDTFASMGPYLVTKDEIPNPHNLWMEFSVNGEVRQKGDTSEMIYSIPEIVSYVSSLFTLEAGDVIMTGTPGGTAAATGMYLRPGDVVQAKIEGLGRLMNPVSKE